MRTIQVLGAAFLIMAVSACSKDESDDNPQTTTGGISGKVSLEDEFGNPLSSSSGMKITSSSSNYDETDADGNFLISGLNEGSYTLVYEKAGFGTFRKFNIPVQPNGGDGITELTGTDILAMSSTTVVSNLAVALNTSDSTLTISCDIGPSPSVSNPRSFRLFFGNNAAVTSADYVFTPPVSWSATTSSGSVTGFQRSLLYNAGFVKGATAYMVAYGESARSNSYTDPSSGKKIYPNLNTGSPSNVVQFIVP